MSSSAAPRRTVLHVDTERGWRGGERQVFWLARELARDGHRSIVAGRPNEPLLERAAEAGLEVFACDASGELDIGAALAMRRFVLDEGVEIVHAHTGHAVSLAAIATLRTPARMVLTRRVDFRLRGNPFSRWKYARAAAVIAISEAVAHVLVASGIDRGRITIVPSGVDLARRIEPASPATLRALGVPPGAPLVVQVSALVAHKDPVNFVHAIGFAHRAVPSLRALLVGDGELRQRVEGAVTQNGLRGVLHITGYRKDADQLLAAADVVTLSSEEEGLGTVLLDALALGKPVVATRAGGIPEVVVDGECGLLVPTRDGHLLGAAIARVLSDPELRRRFGAAGRERAREFSVERTAERTAAVYERVLTRR